jgi:protein-tyrosine phosphatase
MQLRLGNLCNLCLTQLRLGNLCNLCLTQLRRLRRRDDLGYAAPVRILFVCMGNICRSPTAEGVMIELVKRAGLSDRITIDSAGTGAWHVGELPDSRARLAARKRGLDLCSRARQITREDFDRFDLIVVMDDINLRHVTVMAGKSTTPVVLLRSFDPKSPPGANVPDPYAGGDDGFEHVLDLCERACAGLLDYVKAQL